MSVTKNIARQFIQGFLLVAFSAFFASAQTSASREYQVKAIFLFNFTQFVEWPPSSFSSADAPLVIGVLGENHFGSYLNDAVAGERVNGHPLVIQYYKTIADIKPCHVLFIDQSETNKLAKILESLKGQSVLTVSDDPSFLKNGGMIKFYTKSNKIQLQINPDASKAASLVISSKLLRLADIFTTAKK
jgi:hypothetical protein